MIAPTKLTTISYIYDELKECDERQYIELVIEKWGINSIQIACDDAWPFKDLAKWPINPNLPDLNFYRWLKERADEHAQNEGIRVLLTGEYGDLSVRCWD